MYLNDIERRVGGGAKTDQDDGSLIIIIVHYSLYDPLVSILSLPFLLIVLLFNVYVFLSMDVM